MHCAAGAIAACLCQVQGFHHHPLPGHRSVAVNHHRHHLIAAVILPSMLACAYRAFDHRIDDFQMRWIKRQHCMHRPAGGHDVGRLAVVVLDVAGQHFGILLAFERREQILGHFAQRVHQHIEPPAMRHADDEFLYTGCTCTLQKVVEQGNQRIAAFERKTSLTHVFRIEIFFQGFGCG